MIQAAPFIIPIAEALGLSVATLGMAKVTDEVNKYIQENPEQAQKLITTLMPAQGIASMFEGKDDDNLPKKIDEEKTPQEEPPKDPNILPEILAEAGVDEVKNKIQTWEKYFDSKEEAEQIAKKNNITLRDLEVPALKKQITFRKTGDGFDILFDKKFVGELVDITQFVEEAGNRKGKERTFNLFLVGKDGYNDEVIDTIDTVGFAKEDAKNIIAKSLLRDTEDAEYPSLKDIFQNLEYNKKGMPKKRAEETEKLLKEAEERDKKAGLADGGRVNFDEGGIFSINPDEAVKFNLDGETINLNPEFFEMFMGPFMNDPEMLKRRIDDLKQEIRRNQKVLKAADGGIADLLKI